MATVYILTRFLILLLALRYRTLRHLIEHWIRTRSQLMQNCITSSVYLSPYSFKRYPRCLLAKRRKVSLRSGCLIEDTRSDLFIYFFVENVPQTLDPATVAVLSVCLDTLGSLVSIAPASYKCDLFAICLYIYSGQSIEIATFHPRRLSNTHYRSFTA